MNRAFGPPEKLPFDLGHLRHPLTYDLPIGTADAHAHRARPERFRAHLEQEMLMRRAQLHDGPAALGPPQGERLAADAERRTAAVKALLDVRKAQRRLPELLEMRHGRPPPPMQDWTMSQRQHVAFCKSSWRPLPWTLPVR
jgi:hypothetical protein